MLQPGESWQPPAAQSQGFAAQTLQGQLLLSGKPPLNLARYIRELKAYPYGCLEQTASGLFPSLYTSAAQLKALGISGDSDEKAPRGHRCRYFTPAADAAGKRRLCAMG
ncbi:hypothetical protein LNQ03_25850 [Klebsiella pneumoniae subsp. pneumoniae]|nr:hypothetical protein [Klebsiella pneumoniae subsp. pneumoniae]